jgi:hypothetical protein
MKSITDVEIAVAEYIDWSTTDASTTRSRLIPPAELEGEHWASHDVEHYPETAALTAVGGL